MMTNLKLNISMIGFVVLAAIFAFSRPVETQHPSAALPAPHFHHIHLNSGEPDSGH